MWISSRASRCLTAAAALFVAPWLWTEAVRAQTREPERSDIPVARAQRATTPIVVDGRLDDAEWEEAPAIGALTQREPREGQPAGERTEIRVLFDDQQLYLGIVCYESHKGRTVSTQLSRDANLDVDDRITIVIDPFLDHRNGFFFMINPSGARTDGQISNNAEHLIRDWDGIWNAVVVRGEDSWTVEASIPFKTLRFKAGQTTWGFNVERQIKHLNENDRWASARMASWIGNLAEAGQLTGLQSARQGRGLDVRPYVLGGRDSGDGQFTGGLDVFKNITPSLNAAVTVNTDFAETEDDIRQVNLTRFPLFYPEKRTFFLEGAGVFDVAGLSGQPDLIPLFTRRIGLYGDEDTGGEVPIAVGAKVIGRQAGYNVGVLDVETRALPEAGLSAQNMFAGRVSRNMFEQSWVGAIVTAGNPDGTGRNTLIGADARFATSKFRGNRNLALDLFFERTDDAVVGQDYAGGIGVSYPNDLWDVNVSWKQIGDRFQPALGFLPRAGIRKSNLRLAYQPRPQRWGIRQLFFEFQPEYITDLRNEVLNWRLFTAPFNARTESGEHLEWNVIPEFERVTEPFEIYHGVFVPVGSYQWHKYRAEANTATKRWWVIDFAYWWGGFYDGTRKQTGLGLTLKPSSHLSIALRVDRNDIALSVGSFYTQVMSTRIDYNFTPNISWQNLQQYDNETRLLSFQSRFRWILKPGSDLFFVVNRGWVQDFEDRFQPTFNRTTTKLQYTFRF